MFSKHSYKYSDNKLYVIETSEPTFARVEITFYDVNSV